MYGESNDVITLTLSDLSRSLKVKYDGIIGVPIYGVLLMVNSNIWPNTVPLRDISLQNE